MLIISSILNSIPGRLGLNKFKKSFFEKHDVKGVEDLFCVGVFVKLCVELPVSYHFLSFVCLSNSIFAVPLPFSHSIKHLTYSSIESLCFPQILHGINCISLKINLIIKHHVRIKFFFGLFERKTFEIII